MHLSGVPTPQMPQNGGSGGQLWLLPTVGSQLLNQQMNGGPMMGQLQWQRSRDGSQQRRQMPQPIQAGVYRSWVPIPPYTPRNMYGSDPQHSYKPKPLPPHITPLPLPPNLASTIQQHSTSTHRGRQHHPPPHPPPPFNSSNSAPVSPPHPHHSTAPSHRRATTSQMATSKLSAFAAPFVPVKLEEHGRDGTQSEPSGSGRVAGRKNCLVDMHRCVEEVSRMMSSLDLARPQYRIGERKGKRLGDTASERGAIDNDSVCFSDDEDDDDTASTTSSDSVEILIKGGASALPLFLTNGTSLPPRRPHHPHSGPARSLSESPPLSRMSRSRDIAHFRTSTGRTTSGFGGRNKPRSLSSVSSLAGSPVGGDLVASAAEPGFERGRGRSPETVQVPVTSGALMEAKEEAKVPFRFEGTTSTQKPERRMSTSSLKRHQSRRAGRRASKSVSESSVTSAMLSNSFETFCLSPSGIGPFDGRRGAVKGMSGEELTMDDGNRSTGSDPRDLMIRPSNLIADVPPIPLPPPMINPFSVPYASTGTTANPIPPFILKPTGFQPPQDVTTMSAAHSFTLAPQDHHAFLGQRQQERVEVTLPTASILSAPTNNSQPSTSGTSRRIPEFGASKEDEKAVVDGRFSSLKPDSHQEPTFKRATKHPQDQATPPPRQDKPSGEPKRKKSGPSKSIKPDPHISRSPPLTIAPPPTTLPVFEKSPTTVSPPPLKGAWAAGAPKVIHSSPTRGGGGDSAGSLGLSNAGGGSPPGKDVTTPKAWAAVVAGVAVSPVALPGTILGSPGRGEGVDGKESGRGGLRE
ncbi:hypothetical protein HDU67_004169 [Dinochytrium kinnereticum]|nr:hypothetical protein HDU67_004169 [Dinochytrium kinnereticum]